MVVRQRIIMTACAGRKQSNGYLNMNRKTKIIKQALKDSLLELLEEKPLTSVSVRNLCDRADINRSTFYAHYEDINALVAEMEEDFISHVVFFDGNQPTEDNPASVEKYVHYVKENQRLFLLLLDNGKLSSSFLAHSAKMNYYETDFHYYTMLAAYTVYGSISALSYWLKNPGSRTEQEMAQLIYRCSCAIAELQF